MNGTYATMMPHTGIGGKRPRARTILLDLLRRRWWIIALATAYVLASGCVGKAEASR